MMQRQMHVFLLGVVALAVLAPPSLSLPQLNSPLVPPLAVGPVPAAHTVAAPSHLDASRQAWSSGRHCEQPTWRPRCHAFVFWGPLLWGIGASHVQEAFEDQAETRRPTSATPRTWRRSDAEQRTTTEVLNTHAVSSTERASPSRIVHVVH